MTSEKFDLLTDDYVAELLAKEATDCSLKYSSMGLEAYRSSKPVNKAKPNTRFLRTIIKETKNHNEALLAKEAAESQARLRDLARTEEKERRRKNAGPADIRRRQLGDIAAILSGRKRKRDRADGEEEQFAQPSGSGLPSVRETLPRQEGARDGERSSPLKQHHRQRSRSRSPLREDVKRSARDSVRRERDEGAVPDSRRERKHRRYRSRSLDEGRLDRKQSAGRDGARTSRGKSRRSDARNDGDAGQGEEHDDSDPLDDFIGPALPAASAVTTRGRGMTSRVSGIDTRFSADYDAKTDVDPDSGGVQSGPGGEDWEDALEAFRDRQKWKQQGAERLRAAGFTEDEVEKWANGGEKRVEDVRWAMKGEERVWDREKVVRPDGEVEDGN